MTTTKTARTCANCAVFHADPEKAASPAECWNLVSIVGPGPLRRAPRLTDSCSLHQTHQEDAEQTAYIDQHRDSIMAGIRQYASSERIMQKAMVKMRKGTTP